MTFPNVFYWKNDKYGIYFNFYEVYHVLTINLIKKNEIFIKF